MNAIEPINTPPRITMRKRGYKETKVCFLSGGRSVIDKGYDVSAEENTAIDMLVNNAELNEKYELLNGYVHKDNNKVKLDYNKNYNKKRKIDRFTLFGYLAWVGVWTVFLIAQLHFKL